MTLFLRAAVLVAAFALLISSNASAAATYREKGFFCAPSSSPTASVAGTLTVNFPSLTSMTGQVETVYFLALVYRYNSSTGIFDPYRYVPVTVNVANPGTWYIGMANGNGPIAYQFSYGMFYNWMLNGTLAAEPTIGLPKGYYKVGEFFRWQNGVMASTWATLVDFGATPAVPVGVKGGYCTI